MAKTPMTASELMDIEDPMFEPPPVLPNTDERRLPTRAYDYWTSLLKDRPFPSVLDLEPSHIEEFRDKSVLLDFSRDPTHPVLRYIGPLLREECGITLAEARPEEVPGRSLVSRLTDHYLEIIAARAPIGFEAEFESARGTLMMYRGILLPLSDDGETINFIYGVINWKEAAAADVQEALEHSLSDALADASSSILLSKEASAAHTMAERPNSLASLLALARAEAENAKGAEARSRAALYAALSQAYDFSLAAATDPEAFQDLLAEAGLKMQDRARFTPVVKLVFGVDYDKTRLAEYAAALSHAARNNVSAGGFIAYVQEAEGGLKGLVLAERIMRRMAEGEVPSDRAEMARKALRQAKPIAVLSAQEAPEGEFVLLLARRSTDGQSLEVVAPVQAPEGMIESALRRIESSDQ